MSSSIDVVNAGALALREVHRKYHNLPEKAASPFALSRTAPYFGFVDVQISDCPQFVMFSNNDDFVAKNYFWNGADAYEPMSLKLWLALAKSSAFVFDIGSYTGVYSLAAARQNRKCKIFAFEALDTVYGRLLINKFANGLGNIEVHHLAVSDKEGLAEFNVYAGDSVLSTGSTLVEKHTGRSVFQKKQVRTARLDDLLDELNVPCLDLMKIDAEGAEHLIFKGGQEVIQKNSPDIICEFLKGAQSEEIESTLSGMGYGYFRIDEQKMSVEPVAGIAVGETMDTLNTLITRKSLEQIHHLLMGKA